MELQVDVSRCECLRLDGAKGLTCFDQMNVDGTMGR